MFTRVHPEARERTLPDAALILRRQYRPVLLTPSRLSLASNYALYSLAVPLPPIDIPYVGKILTLTLAGYRNFGPGKTSAPGRNVSGDCSSIGGLRGFAFREQSIAQSRETFDGEETTRWYKQC